MEAQAKKTTSSYYNYRKAIQDLYTHDTYYGDLAGEVLKYRDQHKFVESIAIDMSVPKIEVEFTENKHMSKIISDIGSVITNYVRTSASQLNMDREQLDGLYTFLDNQSIVDVYSIGNVITFSL